MQCRRAIASDRRIILSNWRTVILHEDFVIPERERKRGEEERGVERKGKSKMKRRREREREGGEEGGMVG